MKAQDEVEMTSDLLRVKSLETIPESSQREAQTNIAPVKVPLGKRAFDLLCLVIALPTLLPLMLGIAALIKIVSPGPIFFTQDRIGFMGKRFRMFKFRTMRPNAETSSHQDYLKHLIKNSDTPMIKMDAKGDPRVIPFGRILRSSGLDELPQLINVLKGEMSLVGPRPCTPYEYEQFQPWHKQRFRALHECFDEVTTGIQGLHWQILRMETQLLAAAPQQRREKPGHGHTVHRRRVSAWLDRPAE